MMLQDLDRLLKSTSLPVAYSHFIKSVQPPFICYFEDEQENDFADNKITTFIKSVVVELYTDKKDVQVESKLENLFSNNNILWTSTSQYIKEENLFMKAYYIEIMEVL